MHKAVLCVDDERMILDSLKIQLERGFGSEFIYETAENVEEAWEVIEELQLKEVDLLVIVSDWLMPGVRGDEFLIRVHQRFPKIVKVMLTGHADSKSIERTQKEAGLFCCMHKPWAEEELINTIRLGLKLNEKMKLVPFE
jgi:DNA-binding NtrC family response regulator